MEWEQLDKRILKAYRMVQQVEAHKGIFIIEEQKGQWYFLKVVPEESIDLSLVEKLASAEVEGVNRIIEWFTAGGSCYLIKEYIHGTNLFDTILGQGSFSEAQTLDMLIALCESLNDLNDKCGLVFKDLHPKNIMIYQGNYVLVDTETVRVVKEDQSVDTQVIGVAGFMAPEQYGFAQSTIQSDMYSLGMIARFARTGEIPSLKKNQIAIGEDLVSAAAIKVLDRLTAFAPEKRYEDYSTCLKALQLARQGRAPAFEKRRVIYGAMAFLCFALVFSVLSSPESTETTGGDGRDAATESGLENDADGSSGDAADHTTMGAVEEDGEEAAVEEGGETEAGQWWMESKPVVNRAYWEAAFGLPFEADWIPATYDMDEGLDQYLEDLSVSYWLDEEAIYYRLQYQTAYPSRVAMFSASNQEDHLFSFVNEGSVNGSNDWVLGLKREDLRSIGRENTGLLIDLFDSQPFEKRYLRIPYVDEIFMESDRPLYVRSMNVLNFHAVTLSLVEWFEGEWETLDIAYLDGSEDRIQDLQATSLKTDEDIYIHLTYQSRYPADVVFYLPGGQEGLQSRIEGGTGIGENQWTIRLSKEEWETAAAAAGATKVVMNLMLGSLDNPGNIMIEMP